VSFNVNVSARSGLDRGFAPLHFTGNRTLAYPDVRVMLAWARDWLDQDSERPFFLYLHPMNIHGPYRVPPLASARLLGRAPSPGFEYYGKPMKSIMKGAIAKRDEVTPALITSLVEKYDTAIRYTTDQVGGFLAWLETTERFADSIIIVTADHGEELFDHGGFSHGYSLYEEVLHVPLWVKLPDQAEPTIVELPVQLTDVLPTVLDVLDLPALADLDGKSFADPPSSTCAEPSRRGHQRFSARWWGRCLAEAATRWPHKLISTSLAYDGTIDSARLFDLADDPHELNDLAPSQPDLTAELARLLPPRQVHCQADDPAADEVDDETVEQLRALGYVQ
jgi:arylsulfatase A-like enzyme